MKLNQGLSNLKKPFSNCWINYNPSFVFMPND